MSDKPKILFVCDSRETAQQVLGPLADQFEPVTATSLVRGLAYLKHEPFEGVFVSKDYLEQTLEIGKFLQNEQILDGMPDGVVLLDGENVILWANDQIRRWSGQENLLGTNFYAALGNPEILGPDFCPFHTALATGSASGSNLRAGDHRYFHVHAAPVRELRGPAHHLIVTVRDVSQEMLQQQKLAAIHQAGLELADLSPEELSRMSIHERIDLLKSNILHYTQDLLKFEVVEVRLLDAKTGRLEPLLAVGMTSEAAGRVLYAQPQDNGVTGFVAATGKSYLCEDTTEDPLYLSGAAGAKSSLTVPLVLHDDVIGTFNVESPEPRAFTESDLQFLEIFTRDVAVALNTLELLVAEKATATAQSVEQIHAAVALPVDEILGEAVNLMERYIGHEPEVVERLQRILRHARDIKQVIQSVGQKMAPIQAHPQPLAFEPRPALCDRRVLLVDEDSSVRSAGHALLERYGCVVETAPNGAQAVFMVRNMLTEGGYDVVIADIRLPDLSGYDFMVKLQEILGADTVPLVLMTGFGYDPGHSIVKARQAGLQAVLYKPFRLDQLLDTVETVIAASGSLKT
ncbi:MAG TPA: response regulator [Thermoguttaceae bacterium]|nr:response regulator [Thermoguttaceae bacterium]